MKWIIIFIITGSLVFLNSLANGLVWDDEVQIINNPAIRSFSNIGQIFSSGTFDTGGAGLSKGFYRPMVTLYYTFIYAFFGQNAFGYHLAQIVLHIVNGILIFKFIGQYTKERWAGWMSLIWLVHSGISKTVVYAASVGDVLYTLFGLLAFKNPLFLFLALLSKESAILLIPLLIIFNKKNIYSVFSVSLGYGLLRLAANINIPKLDLAPITQASFYERFLTFPSIFGNYLRLVFWPEKLSISQHWVIYDLKNIQFWGWFIPIIIFFILCFWILSKIKSGESWVMFIWFLMGIFLISNLIVPLDGTLDETWLYFPLIGFVGFLATILNYFDRKSIAILLGLIVLLLSIRTFVRNFEWHDGLILYEQAIKNSPPSYELENNYGVELFRNKKISEAKSHFEKSIELQPRWWFAYNNLGAVYQRQGDIPKAEDLYRKSIERADYYLAYENLAVILYNKGNLEETKRFTQAALLKFPQNAILNEILRLSNLPPK